MRNTRKMTAGYESYETYESNEIYQTYETYSYSRSTGTWYGVASSSRLLKMIGLFCKRAL